MSGKAERLTPLQADWIEFQARRLANAVGHLGAARVELEEAKVAPHVQTTVEAERQRLVDVFRATAARAGWDEADIEEVCE